VFVTLDTNNDGSITHAEFILGLKKNPWVAELLGMPAHIQRSNALSSTLERTWFSHQGINSWDELATR
jgi:hypothetical protein